MGWGFVIDFRCWRGLFAVFLPSFSSTDSYPLSSLSLLCILFSFSIVVLRERGNFGQGPGVYLGYLNFFKGDQTVY
ncbi:hypothetical protein DFP73DRAFT_577400 [Morchella snyderi]|nr:hypothetical protein DFP73DRAFT_577400 [Morchella snyderi]